MTNDLVPDLPLVRYGAERWMTPRRPKEHRPVATVDAHSIGGRGLLDFRARTVGSSGREVSSSLSSGT